jgi:outer membrane protein assembly factor BamB
MKNHTIGIKKHRIPLYISLILLFSVLLTSCTGSALINNWPGLSVNKDVAYLSYQGYVYAVNSGTGSMVWKYPKEKGDMSKPFYAAPAFDADGRIFVGNYGHVLYALKNDGNVDWQFAVTNANFVATPLVVDNLILAPASDYYLYAIDSKGTQRWKYKTNNMVWAQPASDGNLAFQPSLDHFLYALRLDDGSLAWKTDLESSLVSSPVLSPDGKQLYVSTMIGDIFALNTSDGSVVWQTPTQGRVWASPVLNKDMLYVGNSNGTTKGNVLALSTANGKIAWTKDAGGPVIGGGALLPDSETIVFPLETGSLTAWSLADGAVKWPALAIGGKLYTTPVVAGDHLIVAVSEEKTKVLQAVTFNGQLAWPFALPK